MATIDNVDSESTIDEQTDDDDIVTELEAELDALSHEYAKRGLSFQEISDIFIARARAMDRSVTRKMTIDECEDEVGESIDVVVIDDD